MRAFFGVMMITKSDPRPVLRRACGAEQVLRMKVMRLDPSVLCAQLAPAEEASEMGRRPRVTLIVVRAETYIATWLGVGGRSSGAISGPIGP